MGEFNEKYFIPDEKDKNATAIDGIIGEDEQVLWRGKPKKSAFILNAVVKMLPIALIWLLFDGVFIGILIANGEHIPAFFKIFVCVFLVFHLIPVWIWIANVVTASRRHKNTEYAFTNKRIIVRSGVVGIDFRNIYYADVDSVNLKVGLIDKMTKVGDIYINAKSGSAVILDVENPYFLTQKLQKIVVDIKTDVLFPNDLRPETNRGYKTKYDGGDKE